MWTTIQKLEVSKIFFFKEINTSIQQEYIKLTKSDSEGIYNVTKISTLTYTYSNVFQWSLLCSSRLCLFDNSKILWIIFCNF